MKKTAPLFTFAILLILTLALSACADAQDAPAQSVLLYYQALADKNQDDLINYVCADYEMQAYLESDSFVSVETELVDAACQTVSENGDTAQVTCDGAITATYNGEAREFPLSGRTYTVINENGEWRLCGYE